jgi:hypothetical protein
MAGDGGVSERRREKLVEIAEERLKRVAKLAMYHLEHLNYSIEMRWTEDAVVLTITVKIRG